MREIRLDADGFMQILSEALKEVPPLRDYDHCPSCGRPGVAWESPAERHRCPWHDCNWIEDTKSLPLKTIITGRPLTPGEILKMVRKEIEERQRCPGGKG